MKIRIKIIFLILLFILLNLIEITAIENNEKYTTELNSDSTLEDYIQYALLNNSYIKRDFYRWNASIEKTSRDKGLPDPTFTYGYFIREIETRLGPQKQFFGLSQKVPWFGKLRLKGELADEYANSQFQRYNKSKLDLIYKFKKNYFEYYFLDKSLGILNENIKLLNFSEQVVQSKFKSGSAVFDVLKIQIEKRKIEENLNTIKDKKKSVIANLNMYLNRDIETFIEAPQNIPEEIIDLTEIEIFDLIEISNPVILSLKHDIQKSKFNLELAKKDAFPDFVFGINYFDIDKSIMEVEDSGKDAVSATFMVNLPIWYKKYRGSQREALNSYKSSIYEMEEKIIAIKTELKDSFIRYKKGLRNFFLYRNDLIKKAEQWLKIAEAAYQTGTLDVIDYIDSQKNLLEFQLTAERSLTDIAIEIAKIEMLAGSELAKKQLTYETMED